MKYLAMLLVVLSTNVQADQQCSNVTSDEHAVEQREIRTDVPKFLKGATIIVRLADGTESKASAELFKVVPRKQQYLVTRTLRDSTTQCVEILPILSEELPKNRLSLMGGKGPSGKLNRGANPSKQRVSTEQSLLGGLQYQRNIYENISVGVQGQTNKTGALLLGLDF